MPLHPLLRAALCAALVCACSEQGEGERCDPNNGRLDCEPGLVCRTLESLNFEDEVRGAALCCPQDGVPPTVDVCRATSTIPDEADAGRAPDMSVIPAPTGDAGDGGP